jgi:geranylgeranyl pyrophosphate synthase
LPDTAYVAASLLRALPESEARSHWLTEIAAGRARVALAHQSNPCVADAEAADLLLVQQGDAVLAYSSAQVGLEYNRSIDASRRMYRLDTQGHAGQCLQADGAALWAATYDRASLSVAAQHLGLAARMLDLSVDYSAQRKQFGKPIGSFQAVKHHLADVAVQLEFARPVLYRAAYALQHGELHADVLVSHARIAASEAALLAARKGIQVHGAMGYTWEADLQMFMKRAWALDHSWGSRGVHQARVAQWLLAADAEIGPGHTFASRRAA